MKRQELERKYEERGLTDYQLQTLEDLKEIHGVDVTELNGYNELTDENKELFNSTVIKFFNTWGLDNRKELRPKNVHYVSEVTYEKEISENEIVDAGIEIFVINSKTGAKINRIHRYVFEKDIPFRECRKYIKHYLRFELQNEWYHITANGEWY